MSRESEGGNSSRPHEEHNRNLRRKLAVGIGALVVGGIPALAAATRWLVSSRMKPTVPVITEIIPEDPEGFLILDPSWQKYTKKNGFPLQSVADQLFPLLRATKRELEKIFPPLPKDSKLRLVYEDNISVIMKEGFGFYGRFGLDEEIILRIEKNDKAQPFHIRKPGKESLTLPGINETTIQILIHELAHYYLSRAGLISCKSLNEGLATYLEQEVNPLLKRGVIQDPDIDQFLEVFPELWIMPMNTPLTTAENFRDWAQLGEIYYRKGAKFFRDWEKGIPGKLPAHSGFVKAWAKELTEANEKKEKDSETHESLSLLELVEIGERVNPGFKEYAVRHPILQIFGEKPTDYFLMRAKGKRIYIVNLRSGIRKISIGRDSFAFNDLLPSLSRMYTVFDTRGMMMGERTSDKTIGIESIEDMETDFNRIRYERRTIGSIEFRDGSGKLNRIQISRD